MAAAAAGVPRICGHNGPRFGPANRKLRELRHIVGGIPRKTVVGDWTLWYV